MGHFSSGAALLEQRKCRDAIVALVGAVEAVIGANSGSPQNTQVDFTKATTELASRNKETAIITLGNTISSDPQFAPAYFESARLKEKRDL